MLPTALGDSPYDFAHKTEQVMTMITGVVELPNEVRGKNAIERPATLGAEVVLRAVLICGKFRWILNVIGIYELVPSPRRRAWRRSRSTSIETAWSVPSASAI